MSIVLKNARLAAFDFDNTIAETFRPSPHGIDVKKACNMALMTMFREEDLLNEIGGLQNRAPTEVVHDLIRAHPKFRAIGLTSYEKHRERLAGMMPRGIGIPLTKSVANNTIELLGEMFVRLKLEILLGEVCDEWPRPCEGVLDVFSTLRASDKALAIISSGHRGFIEQCFRIWKAECPRVILSDDELRPKPDPLSKKIKPNRLLMDYVRITAHGVGIKNVGFDQIFYFGDDPEKDGKLARNAGTAFGWYNRDRKNNGFQPVDGDLVFSDWSEVERVLH